ncbi:MAG: hypothetical protein KI792_01110 [Alphaproteobacteria bacterium]|nr:hypothetical protein [Alphaproteobacteria bacterium SS10]
MSLEAGRHPLASEHIHYFITAPGGFDQMLYVVAGILVLVVLGLGGFYFWLHSLPERIAHGRQRTQMELVAVLGLIGLFTHNNIFWIAALLLAMIELPDLSNPIGRMADALERLSGSKKSERDGETDAAPASTVTAEATNAGEKKDAPASEPAVGA